MYIFPLFLLLFLGPKSQKKFKRLMMHRIKWEEHNSKRDGKIMNFESLWKCMRCCVNRLFCEIKISSFYS